MSVPRQFELDAVNWRVGRMTPKSALPVVLLIGLTVAAGWAAAGPNAGSAQAGGAGAAHGSRFAAGLPKPEDRVAADAAADEAKTAGKEPSKQPAAGAANEGLLSSKASNKAAKQTNGQTKAIEEQGRAKTKKKGPKKKKVGTVKAATDKKNASEIAEKGLKSIEKQTQERLDAALANQKKVVEAMNGLAPEIGPKEANEDFLVPMQ